MSGLGRGSCAAWVLQDKDKKNKKSKKSGPAETLKCKPFATALAEAMLDRVRARPWCTAGYARLFGSLFCPGTFD